MFKRENAWKWVTAALLAYGFFGCTVAEARMHTEHDPAHAWIRYAKQVNLEFGLPAGLLQSICSAESDWRPDLVGSAGEIGLCQMKPGTLAMFSHDDPKEMLDPYHAIYYAGVYLQWMAKQLKTNSPDILAAAYNRGPYSEVVRYMQKVRSRR